jgi:hypothetical protein
MPTWRIEIADAPHQCTHVRAPQRDLAGMHEDVRGIRAFVRILLISTIVADHHLDTVLHADHHRIPRPEMVYRVRSSGQYDPVWCIRRYKLRLVYVFPCSARSFLSSTHTLSAVHITQYPSSLARNPTTPLTCPRGQQANQPSDAGSFHHPLTRQSNMSRLPPILVRPFPSPPLPRVGP